MINPAELDTRLMSHAARVDVANRYGPLVPQKCREEAGPGSFVLQLRRLSDLLGRGQARPTTGGSAA